jgi:hypothetical protein
MRMTVGSCSSFKRNQNLVLSKSFILNSICRWCRALFMSSLVPILYIKARDQLDSNVHIILIIFVVRSKSSNPELLPTWCSRSFWSAPSLRSSLFSPSLSHPDCPLPLAAPHSFSLTPLPSVASPKPPLSIIRVSVSKGEKKCTQHQWPVDRTRPAPAIPPSSLRWTTTRSWLRRHSTCHLCWVFFWFFGSSSLSPSSHSCCSQASCPNAFELMAPPLRHFPRRTAVIEPS